MKNFWCFLVLFALFSLSLTQYNPDSNFGNEDFIVEYVEKMLIVEPLLIPEEVYTYDDDVGYNDYQPMIANPSESNVPKGPEIVIYSEQPFDGDLITYAPVVVA